MKDHVGDGARPGEMTDQQLDQLLAAAGTDLLDHVKATADHARTLTALMAHSDQQHHHAGAAPPPATPPGESRGPALTTLRAVVAYAASTLRLLGVICTVAQVVIWHSFYLAFSWRLAGPVAAVTWGIVAVTLLRRFHWGWLLTALDSCFYVSLALCTWWCVPPALRDGTSSWLFLTLIVQSVTPGWITARGAVALLTFAPAAAYWVATATTPTAGPWSSPTLTAGALLLVVPAASWLGGRMLYRRATSADAVLGQADRDAQERYAILRSTIERREHDRLLHDTVLATLTALARAGSDDMAEAVTRCRQDVALIERALGAPGDPPGDLLSELGAVVADMRARGLNIHVEAGDGEAPTVPAPVARALSNAAREALSNVAAHAGTREAWVQVRIEAPEEGTRGPRRLEVIVRDEGAGFDLARVDRSRLGLRRSVMERTADSGGQATIWSAPGQGTVVRLSCMVSGQPGEPDPVGCPQADSALTRDGVVW
jgi:signal transduction histidine kinase